MRILTFSVVLLLVFNSAAREVFHFEFSGANGKKDFPAESGAYRCISDTNPMVVQNGALRIAPAANIYITGKFPQLKDEITVSLWFLRRNKSWDTPLLMRGYHAGRVDFLLQCRYVYPAFCYKDPASLGQWEGLYVQGPIPRDMHYGKKEWRITRDFARSDVWNHLLVTFNRGEIKIYLNGKLNCRSVSNCKTLSNSSDRIYIGSERLSAKTRLGYLTGDFLVNDIRLFDTALSETDSAAVYWNERAAYRKKVGTLADCNAYPPVPGYDPEFRIKLKRTTEYETKPLPDSTIKSGQSDARTVVQNGARILNIGGKNYFPLSLSPAAKRGNRKLFSNVRDFAAAGVDLINLGVPVEQCWKGIGKYDFKPLDERARTILAANPKARLMAWIMLRPPVSWFSKQFPDEIEQSRQGDEMNRNVGGGPLGSDFWLDQSDAFLAALVEYIERSPYADRVFGYLPAGGESGEWYWPGGVYQMVVGFSPATRKSFRSWLRNTYRNDPTALCLAWNRTSLDFGNAEVPSAEIREKMDYPDDFLDIRNRRDVLDFRKYMCDRTLMAIRRAAKIIKQKSAGKKLVFLYNGYSFNPTPKKLYNSGLLISEGVLKTPEIDVIVTPLDYSERRWKQYGACVNPWAASAALNGKLSWQEDDPRTHFCLTAAASRTESAAETTETFKRDIGLALTKNTGNWWLLFEPHWCHDELTMSTVAASQRIVDEALKHNRKPAAQAAFFWDESSIYHLNRVKGRFFLDFASLAYRGSFQMGAPADFYLSGDLCNPHLPDYKLYVMLNFFKVSEPVRKAIEAKAKRNNAVVVWCYAPGYLTDSGRSVSSMEKLTGIRLREIPGRIQCALTITDRKHPITRFVQKKGNQYSAAPAFAVDDPSARILGKANGIPALAVREFPQWRSVYSLLPLDTELLTGLCDYAGIHVYSRDRNFLSVNQGYLMLHTKTPRPTKIKLPGKYDVIELYSGTRISSVSDFSVHVPSGTTLIYRLEKK